MDRPDLEPAKSMSGAPARAGHGGLEPDDPSRAGRRERLRRVAPVVAVGLVLVMVVGGVLLAVRRPGPAIVTQPPPPSATAVASAAATTLAPTVVPSTDVVDTAASTVPSTTIAATRTRVASQVGTVELTLPDGAEPWPRSPADISPGRFRLPGCSCTLNVALAPAFPADALIWQLPTLRPLGDSRFVLVHADDPARPGVTLMEQRSGHNLQIGLGDVADVGEAEALLRPVLDSATVDLSPTSPPEEAPPATVPLADAARHWTVGGQEITVVVPAGYGTDPRDLVMRPGDSPNLHVYERWVDVPGGQSFTFAVQPAPPAGSPLLAIEPFEVVAGSGLEWRLLDLAGDRSITLAVARAGDLMLVLTAPASALLELVGQVTVVK